jgi:hypothetical protein
LRARPGYHRQIGIGGKHSDQITGMLDELQIDFQPDAPETTPAVGVDDARFCTITKQAEARLPFSARSVPRKASNTPIAQPS